MLACLAGLAIARTAIDAFVVIGSTTSTQLSELALDGRLVVFALVTSALTSMLVALWPALRISRAALRDGLTEGSVSTTGSRDRRRVASALVIAEVALALVMLVTAGLLIRSFATLVRVDPGFVQSNVAVLRCSRTATSITLMDNAGLCRPDARPDACDIWCRQGGRRLGDALHPGQHQHPGESGLKAVRHRQSANSP